MQPIHTATKRSRPCDDDESDNDGAARSRRARASYGASAEGAKRRLHHRVYEIVWVCALSLERAAAEAVLDEEHEALPHQSDDNIYTLGSIAGHNIVIASLPEGSYGVTRATQVLADTLRTFTSLKYCLMVGIGGGVPGPNNDIRLGDVVVGTKVKSYSPAKVTADGRMRTDDNAKPDRSWLQVLSKVRATHERIAHGIPTRMATISKSCFATMSNYLHPQKLDNLFPIDYSHAKSTYADCRHCDASMATTRDPRSSNRPMVHYGTIASGDDLIKLGAERDRLGNELDVLCFEMEAAGLMDIMRCLPIRGIADYADSHKNKAWQRYAAANAAAFAKEVVESLPSLPSRMSQLPTGQEAITSPQSTHRNGQEQSSTDSGDMFLEFLKFERFDVRRKTMKSSYRKTCRWLLEQAEYREWLDTPCWLEPPLKSRHGGFLWIKGKPGTGKSTLMKFAFEHELQKAKKRQKQSGRKEIVISFFFNARGNEMEQSVEGMYRALILQILQEFTDLQELLDQMDTATIISDGISLTELEGLFQKVAAELGSRRLTCFIDALDEGGREQVVEMVKRFQDLFEDHTSPSSQLRICFSSRHYPYIKPRIGLEMVLENLPGHDKDLDEYVMGNLDIEDSEYRREIATRLLDKARGIFLWTALIVDYLNEDISKGHPVKESLSLRLEQVPPGLHKLFKHILSRHSADIDTFRLMVAWLLFAKEQLSPRQVDHALWSGSHGDGLRHYTPPTFDEPGTEDRLRKRVISASKGLAEVVRTGDTIVQFTHESVRDFLLKDKGLESLWPDGGIVDATACCHELLKDCCDQYLNHPLMAKALSASIPINTMLRKRRSSELLKGFPMLAYACQNLLWHADAAAPSLPQELFLSGIGIPSWTRAVNLFEDFETRFYSPDTDLLSILAHRGHVQLIRGFNCQLSVHDTAPLVAAVAGQQQSTFENLLEKVLPGYRIKEYLKLFRMKDRFEGCKGRTLFTLAAQKGCVELLKRLLQEGVRADEPDDTGKSAIYRALRNDHLSIVKILTGCEECDWNFDTSLEISLQYLSDKCAAWAIANGANIDRLFHFIVVGKRVTALHGAVRWSMMASVQELLMRGVDVNAPADHGGQTPLHIAAAEGTIESTLLLLDQSADPNSIDSQGQTPLHLATMRGGSNTTTLLLDRGADISCVDSQGQTPLHIAASHGRSNTTTLLLDRGADISCVDSQGRTPLHVAARHGGSNTLTLLLDRGASVNIVDSKGRTPLMIACERGCSFSFDSLGALKALLVVDRQVDFCDSVGWTALTIACKNRAMQHMKLLRAERANVHVLDNERKSLYWYVLEFYSYSEEPGDMEAAAPVKALVEWGVKPSLADGESVWKKFYEHGGESPEEGLLQAPVEN